VAWPARQPQACRVSAAAGAGAGTGAIYRDEKREGDLASQLERSIDVIILFLVPWRRRNPQIHPLSRFYLNGAKVNKPVGESVRVNCMLHTR